MPEGEKPFAGYAEMRRLGKGLPATGKEQFSAPFGSKVLL